MSIRLCAALLFVSTSALAEDLTLVFTNTASGKTSTSTQYVTSERMKMSDPEQDFTIEYGPGRIVAADHRKKEYWETTLAEMNAQMQALGAQMEAQMKQMEEQSKGLPPGLRDKMMSAMGGGLAASVKVTKGPGTRKISGYDTQEWLVEMGDAMKMTLWTTTALTFPQPAIDARTAMLSLNPGLMRSMSKLADEMKKVQGFSLAETNTFKLLGKTMESTREATEIRKGAIAASVFALPTGYKKIESPMAKAAAKAK